jgi:tetratricopeptide (TPR) repeat protein
MKKISIGVCNFTSHVLFVSIIMFLCVSNVLGQNGSTQESLVTKLLSTGRELVERTYYLEALDLFEEAHDTLDASGPDYPELYADTLYELARAKIKARLYQNFPAYYVKTALEDVQASNRIRERLDRTIPQKLADGYYLEGFIQKKFFMRRDQAEINFLKALKIDPASVAAKRELSELVSGQEQEAK